MNEPIAQTQSNLTFGAENEGRARLRLAVFVVLGIHLAGLTPLLMLGCRREEVRPPETAPQIAQPTFEPTNLPLAETQPQPVAAPIPAPQPIAQPQVPAPLPTPGPTEYTVAAGDTFYSIGKKFGVSYLAIEAANPDVDPRRLKPGQKILIPAPTTPPGGTEPAVQTAPAAEGQETIYVVKSGDTLTKIAREFGVTVNALRRANNLSTDRIKVGDKLRIPPKAIALAPTQPMAPEQSVPGPVAPSPAR